MTQSNIMPKITAIITEVNAKRDALEDYKNKLDAAKSELEQAKADRQKSFSFETDKKVVELEGFVGRIDRRYTEERQFFDEALPNKLREVEQLFDAYVTEQWGQSAEVRDLTDRAVASFKQTVKLLDEYTRKPQEVKNTALQNVMTPEFRKAFSGEISFMGANNYILANAISLDYNAYQKLYSAGHQLGVVFDEL